MAVLNTGLAKTSASGYEIDQSLRFNDDDTAYLNTTLSGTGGRDKFTYSGWVKLGNIGVQMDLLSAPYSTSQNGSHLIINTDGKFYNQIRDYSTGSQGGFDGDATSDMIFRDPSAWYHIVFAYDSTDGTPADRQKLYVNGVRQTWSAQDTVTEDNVQYLGSEYTGRIGVQYGTTGNLDGYLAEVHFIDGTAYDADDFGEEGDYGEWKPIEVSGLTYGTNGFYLPFNTVNDTIIAATGGTIYTSGDYKYHKFTADGTFTVTSTQGASVVDALVIAGGGGGGGDNGGGGGAGGYRFVEEHSVSATAYSITVGDGGAGSGSSDAANGDNSVFSSITATGGGFGGTNNKTHTGADGGSGGGGAGGTYGTEGSGTSGQGNDGGTPLRHSDKTGGGGGGALEAGNTDGQGAGGDGSNAQSAWATITSSGDSGYYAGGGSGGHEGSSGAIVGGTGGGGSGRGSGVVETAGDANTGGGGGGGASGAAGGSGIVIIRYKYQ